MSKQLLHLVFGGRVLDPSGYDFEDLKAIDFVGVFPDYASAEKAWRGAAQRTVDDAQMKYVVVHLHRILDPDKKPAKKTTQKTARTTTKRAKTKPAKTGPAKKAAKKSAVKKRK